MNSISTIIDYVEIVACATEHRIDSGFAVERVGDRVSSYEVIQRISCSSGHRAEEDEVLYAVCQGITRHPSLDCVDSTCGSAVDRRFRDSVSGIVDDVVIVPVATHQRVGAKAAIEGVIAV